MERPFIVKVELNRVEAAALAQLLKRMTLADYTAKCLPASPSEAYVMQAAAERVRASLAYCGFKPR